MLSFPNCKINLGLNIIRKREDGYHDLETVFLPVPLTDVLEILPSNNNKLEFTVSGIPVNTEDNLCIKAYNLLKQNFTNLPSVKMHLHKSIPIGAGLGGGSSDAAFTLLLLNEKFKLNLKTEQLLDYALRLGSDCPFFILNKPCFAMGRGEKLEPINIDLKNYKILIVNPGININTKWAFSKIIPQERKISIQQIITLPIETWKVYLQNDFELPVFTEYPEIRKIKEDLYEVGALYASLSGSGSSVFGVFLKEKIIKYPQSTKYFNKVVEFN
ncbi:MAG TPA: 4-(cytidine 5'-diphospho)-2-C-methyl-D-erythritol kinase [Chitinophagaceae bacterium]|nr:4-(cytidine 5'-diphospho)-2-C-methyl-D-erythritol kinase [Chitinophagaceae bacterium]